MHVEVGVRLGLWGFRDSIILIRRGTRVNIDHGQAGGVIIIASL